MNSEIGVESKKSEGSTFTVAVTLKDAYVGVVTDGDDLKSHDKKKDKTNFSKPGNDLEGLRVLIAEDIPTNAELLKRILSKNGVEYEWAENGQIAVDMVPEKPENYFDAVLMDIRMPVMDGLQATRNIRSLPRDDAQSIQIIAMTANAFEEDIRLSLQAGMNAHLSKPIDVAQLFDALEKIKDQKYRRDT